MTPFRDQDSDLRAAVGPVVLITLAAFGLGIEALSLSAGPGAAVVGVGFVAVLSVLVIIRTTLVRFALGSTYLAAFFLSWNGWQIGPVRPGDLFVLVALGTFLAAFARDEFPRLPKFVSQLGFVVLLVIVLHEVLPTSPRYLHQRIILDAIGRPSYEIQSNLVVGSKLLVAVVGVAIVFCYAVRADRRAAVRIAVLYSLGTSVSAFVAFTDSTGITAGLGDSLTGNLITGVRTAGFSDHPNFLAGATVACLPIGIWLAVKPSLSSRLAGGFIVLSTLLGTYASGSRGGAVCVVIDILGTVAILPEFRKHLASISLALGAVVAAVFVVFPGLGHAILVATRLVDGGVSTSGSNQLRAIVGEQGLNDFRHSPIDGVGFQVSAEAQNVYLQQLAAGGILLFGSLLVYWVFAIVRGWRLREREDVLRPLVVSLISAEALNFVGASLTDRFTYVPVNIVIALIAVHAAATPSARDDHAAPESEPDADRDPDDLRPDTGGYPDETASVDTVTDLTRRAPSSA